MHTKAMSADFTKILAGILLIFTSGTVSARTLFSGSFVSASIDETSIDVSVNYPSRGIGKICGVELKSQTIILNRLVWEEVSRSILVRESYDNDTDEVSPLIELAEGPRIFYLFQRFDAEYGTLRFSTRDGKTLRQTLARVLGSTPEKEQVVIVARECTDDSFLEFNLQNTAQSS